MTDTSPPFDTDAPAVSAPASGAVEPAPTPASPRGPVERALSLLERLVALLEKEV